MGASGYDGGLFTPKISLAKNHGLYLTPDGVADRIIDQTPLYRSKDDPPLLILKPSASTGNLARPCAMLSSGDHREGGEQSTSARYV